jgi:hypothetical protein
MLCLHYTICLMQLSVVCNLILMGCSDDIPVSGLLVIDAVGWQSMYFVIMPRVNCIVIFLTYHVYLYSINFPTAICLPSMCNLSYGETPLVNCRPWSYFHHIAITYLLYLHCLLYSHTFIAFHSIRSYPLFQANRWDWQPHRKLGTKYLVVCVQVPRCYWPKMSQHVSLNGALVGVLLS